MNDFAQIVSGLGDAARAIGAEVASVWVLIQLALLLLAAAVAAMIGALVRKRADLVALTMGWPSLLRLFARRFTVQERLGEQIADALAELMEPHGVAVHLEAVHLCTQMRGVRDEHSKTHTSIWRGGYTENPELRREFLAQIQNRNRWA